VQIVLDKVLQPDSTYFPELQVVHARKLLVATEKYCPGVLGTQELEPEGE
jgi:hypothetical protein